MAARPKTGRMTTPFLLGCHGRGGQRIPGESVSVDDTFRLIKETRVFDYVDRLPQPGLEKEYLKAAEKYGPPGEIHNIMVYTHHADGHAA
jgi:hypothetical protein